MRTSGLPRVGPVLPFMIGDFFFRASFYSAEDLGFRV